MSSSFTSNGLWFVKGSEYLQDPWGFRKYFYCDIPFANTIFEMSQMNYLNFIRNFLHNEIYMAHGANDQLCFATKIGIYR